MLSLTVLMLSMSCLTVAADVILVYIYTSTIATADLPRLRNE
jgi:hypothetical protein